MERKNAQKKRIPKNPFLWGLDRHSQNIIKNQPKRIKAAININLKEI